MFIFNDAVSFIKGVKRCFEQAEKYLREGDIEFSYLLFSRVLNLYKDFKKSKYFKEADMKFVKLQVATQMSLSMKYLETLQPDLEKK